MSTDRQQSPLSEANLSKDQNHFPSIIQSGYAYPVRVLSPAQAEDCRRKLEEYERRLCCNTIHTRCLSGDDRFKIHLLLPWAWNLVHHPTLIQIARSCLQTEDIWCWSTDVNTKEPGSKSHYTWHQDSTYAGMDPPSAAITVWLALTESSNESGCVKCIPLSHRLGQLPHREGRGGTDNALALQQEIDLTAVGLDPNAAEAMVLRPGEASVHSFLTVHASEPNSSHDRRIGIAIRYVSAHCTKAGKERETASLVSGNGYGLFQQEQEPKVAMGENERRAHRLAMNREKANYLPHGREYT